MNDLTKQHCVPCEGGTEPFSKKEATKYLKVANDWELILGKPMKIARKFAFKNFKEALKFINRVGKLAESEDHHPDIFLHNYRKVDITLSTHAIKGLSVNDFIMAAKINQLNS